MAMDLNHPQRHLQQHPDQIMEAVGNEHDDGGMASNYAMFCRLCAPFTTTHHDGYETT